MYTNQISQMTSITKTTNTRGSLSKRQLFNLFTVANFLLSTQLIKPIWCISLTHRGSTGGGGASSIFSHSYINMKNAFYLITPLVIQLALQVNILNLKKASFHQQS